MTNVTDLLRPGANFLAEMDEGDQDWQDLLTLSKLLKEAKKSGTETQYLRGRNIALVFEKTSTRTRCAFEVAAADQGANTTYLDPASSQMGHKESIEDTAKVLGRFYDGIEYRGDDQTAVETLAANAGVPVFNGLTDQWHPTQMLADALTMLEHAPGKRIAYAYVGDARNNMGRSLMVMGAMMGMDVRIIAPRELWPDEETIALARARAANTGATVTVTENLQAVEGVDFVHTDVWVSMGEPQEVWDKRIKMLTPYRVDMKLMEKAGENAKFMHCLPALHDLNTTLGRKIHEEYGLNGVEVTNEVFTSERSVVFDQSENRLHTIKAVLVRSLGRTPGVQD